MAWPTDRRSGNPQGPKGADRFAANIGPEKATADRWARGEVLRILGRTCVPWYDHEEGGWVACVEDGRASRRYFHLFADRHGGRGAA
jgi:hypothetical protein